MTAPAAPDFDALFAGSDDPWRFRTRWYERRKRALTLAALPRERYRRGFEPGCANGELAAALAARCDALVAADASPRAVGLAAERLRGTTGVELACLAVPAAWPPGRFDLVVISELAYYLDAADRRRLAERIRASLEPGGTVLACHWRAPIDDAHCDGDTVHAELDVALGLPRRGGWVDEDMRIDAWFESAGSVGDPRGPDPGGRASCHASR
ncbi:MAG: methyltransferase domain-containing protein [Burkholderiales bacterium]|nr:MAG: methyltransferase domain-containing protein [Burkholderiales bacterium]